MTAWISIQIHGLDNVGFFLQYWGCKISQTCAYLILQCVGTIALQRIFVGLNWFFQFARSCRHFKTSITVSLGTKCWGCTLFWIIDLTFSFLFPLFGRDIFKWYIVTGYFPVYWWGSIFLWFPFFSWWLFTFISGCLSRWGIIPFKRVIWVHGL